MGWLDEPLCGECELFATGAGNVKKLKLARIVLKAKVKP